MRIPSCSPSVQDWIRRLWAASCADLHQPGEYVSGANTYSDGRGHRGRASAQRFAEAACDFEQATNEDEPEANADLFSFTPTHERHVGWCTDVTSRHESLRRWK